MWLSSGNLQQKKKTLDLSLELTALYFGLKVIFSGYVKSDSS